LRSVYTILTHRITIAIAIADGTCHGSRPSRRWLTTEVALDAREREDAGWHGCDFWMKAQGARTTRQPTDDRQRFGREYGRRAKGEGGRSNVLCSRAANCA